MDYSATTKPLVEAVSACAYAMEVEYGNPASLHKRGFAAEQLVLEAKSMLALALSCKEGEIIFTSGATEANNLAIFGAAEAKKRRGNRIVTTAIEHPSILEPLLLLEKQGFVIERLLPDFENGYTPERIANAVDDETILVSTMWVNNETGLILPVEKIAEAIKCKNPDTLFHSDGVQGFLRQPLALKRTKIDMLSISGHKAYAPKGIGALYIKQGVRIIPQMLGGGQQGKMRSGTEPVPQIHALGAATSIGFPALSQTLLQDSENKAFLKAILSQLPEISFLEDRLARAAFSPHILSFAVKGIRSEVLLHFLEEQEIYVSSGSACAKGGKSHVLLAFSLSNNIIDTTLRVSFGRETTKEQLEIFGKALKQGLDTLAKIR